MADIIESVQQSIDGLTGFIKANPVTSATVGIATAAAVTGGTIAAVKTVKRRKKRAKKSKPRRSRKRRGSRRRRHKRRYTPYTAGKGKDTSTRRIRYTKRGQPYVILRSGKARFISSKSAKLSRRRKGGRY